MEQIKNRFSTIEQMTGQLVKKNAGQTAAKQSPELSFQQLLKQKQLDAQIVPGQGLKFSRHANERLQSRSIDLSSEQVRRLEEGAAKAGAKGIVESLVMVDDYAFIVNTRSRVVVTAVTGNDDRVFTNIDGAVIG